MMVSMAMPLVTHMFHKLSGVNMSFTLCSVRGTYLYSLSLQKLDSIDVIYGSRTAQVLLQDLSASIGIVLTTISRCRPSAMQ